MRNPSFVVAVLGIALAALAVGTSCDPTPTNQGGGGNKDKKYSELVRADSPAVYWRFEETAGTIAADSSGFGRNALYVASPGLGMALSAKLGQAIRLARGVGDPADAVVQNAQPWSDLAALTLEAWIRPNATEYPEGAIILDKGDSWNLIVTPDGHPAVQFPFAPGGRVTGPAVLTPGTLYHLVGTYQPGSPNGVMRLYVNGVLVAANNLEPSAIMQMDRPIHVAQGLTAGRWDFAGTVDEVAIYDHALSAAAVETHYGAGVNSGTTPYSQVVRADAPAAYWRFEETGGTVAADSSGHGRNATYASTPSLGGSLKTALGRAVAFHSYFFNDPEDGVAQDIASWSNLEALSLEAWIRPSQIAYPEPIIVVDKGDSWNLIITADGRPGVQLPFAGAGSRIMGPQALAIDSLYHLVGTFQPGPARGTLRLYVNGNLVASSEAEPPSIPQLARPIHVGQGLTPGRFDYAGIVDEVAIYDHVLSLSSVKKHYDAGH